MAWHQRGLGCMGSPTQCSQGQGFPESLIPDVRASVSLPANWESIIAPVSCRVVLGSYINFWGELSRSGTGYTGKSVCACV